MLAGAVEVALPLGHGADKVRRAADASPAGVVALGLVVVASFVVVRVVAAQRVAVPPAPAIEADARRDAVVDLLLHHVRVLRLAGAAEHAVVPHEAADLSAGLVVRVRAGDEVGPAHGLDHRVVADRQAGAHGAHPAVDADLARGQVGPEPLQRLSQRLIACLQVHVRRAGEEVGEEHVVPHHLLLVPQRHAVLNLVRAADAFAPVPQTAALGLVPALVHAELRAVEVAGLAGLAIQLDQAHDRGRVVREARLDRHADYPAEEIARAGRDVQEGLLAGHAMVDDRRGEQVAHVVDLVLPRVLEPRLARRGDLGRDVPVALLRGRDQLDGLIHALAQPRVLGRAVEAGRGLEPLVEPLVLPVGSLVLSCLEPRGDAEVVQHVAGIGVG